MTKNWGLEQKCYQPIVFLVKTHRLESWNVFISEFFRWQIVSCPKKFQARSLDFLNQTDRLLFHSLHPFCLNGSLVNIQSDKAEVIILKSSAVTMVYVLPAEVFPNTWICFRHGWNTYQAHKQLIVGRYPWLLVQERSTLLYAEKYAKLWMHLDTSVCSSGSMNKLLFD